MTTHGAGGSARAPQPEYLFKCNIRTELNGMFVDLSGGGGGDPPVIAFDNRTFEHNANQIWSLWTVPNKSTILIKSEANGQYLIGYGHNQRVRALPTKWWEPNAQWHVEGGDVRQLHNDTVVKLRNSQHSSCLLDQEGGNGNRAPFITYEAHGGPNQCFKLWKR